MATTLDWIHRFTPGDAEPTILLLHGSGANEDSLFEVGLEVAPGCALLAVRGRSLEEGSPRFFRRFSATRYDQEHLIHEANALAAFVNTACKEYKRDPQKVIALGLSNGANIALAVLALQPKLFSSAILFRCVMPFDAPPQVDLERLPVLITSGMRDPFLPYAEAAARYLKQMNAELRDERLPAGHELTARDIDIARVWLGGIRETPGL